MPVEIASLRSQRHACEVFVRARYAVTLRERLFLFRWDKIPPYNAYAKRKEHIHIPDRGDSRLPAARSLPELHCGRCIHLIPLCEKPGRNGGTRLESGRTSRRRLHQFFLGSYLRDGILCRDTITDFRGDAGSRVQYPDYSIDL